MNAVERLLQLHSEGRISDEALDKSLKSLEPKNDTDSSALENLQQQRDAPKEKKNDTDSSTLENLRKRRRNKKKRKQRDAPKEEKNALKLVDKPLCNYFKAYEIDAHKYKDPSILFNDKKSIILDQIRKDIKEYNGIKFSIGLSLEFFKDELDGERKEVVGVGHGEQCAVLNENNLDEHYNKQTAYIQTWIEKFTNTASGLEIDHCVKLYLNIAKYEPLKGSSYIPLPEVIANKQAIINIKNDDNKCLEWALKSALYPAKNHLNNLYSYTKCPNLNMEGIDFPTPISQISKVEKQNNIAINVYGYTITKKTEKLTIFPYHISNQPNDKERINLLLITEDVEVEEEIDDSEEGIIDEDYNPDDYSDEPTKETKYHYCWIKSLNRLLRNQNNKHGATYFCERCLYGFSREDLLINHKEDCEGINKSSMRIEMPSKGRGRIKFKNYKNQMPVPFVIYADFESIIKSKSQQKGDKSEITSEHEACGFGYQVVRYDGKAEEPVVYRGEDAVETFINHLECEVNNINNIFRHPKPIIMTEQNIQDYENATHCWICEMKLINNEKNPKVKDHCHFTGEYRGATHKFCNLKLAIKPNKTKIPVVFHNLKGYDSHLIMQKIHKASGNITCIANNAEKYISFNIGQLKFLDSFQFMALSLEKLVDATDKSDFKLTREVFGNKTDTILRKGVYPYEYIDSQERFDETQLPPIEKFYSSLTDESITQKDYEHAQTVWKTFKCKTLGDYHDLYLKTDVLLLADVFQKFRETCMNNYKLDPLHYYTAPGLSWDALLKYTQIDLELLTDLDMHLFIEKGMRGGISMVSKRHAKANNPLIADYDPNKDDSYIMYLDANNLYGHSMSQPLPYGGFKWLTNKDGKLPPLQKGKGRIYEVDLEYPKHLHKLHNDYPLAPEKLAVKKEWLSDYQNELLDNNSMLNVEKLVPNLMDKKKYVVHYKNLQLYLKLGMKIKKIHRILEFDEKPWMEPYIRLNTELRKKAKSSFEKDFFKLMNNSVFGKTMENIRKRVDIKLVRTDGSENEKLRKIIAKPNFNRRVKFSDELSAIHVHKTKLTLNKPIYVGFSVLELSKHHMYDWYYNTLKKKYGEDCTLLYTDTDSLLVDIKTKDAYKDMSEMKDEYDFSDYPKEHSLHNETNKKIIGKFKDECSGVAIAEYIGLRPKLYSIMRADEQVIKKAKGVKKYVIKKQINFENYKDALFNKQKYTHSMNMLSSMQHNIYGLKINKTTLSPLDTKRYIAPDGITTYAYGYQAEQ